MALDTREPQNSPYKRNPRQITILDPSLRSDQHAATKQTEKEHQKSEFHRRRTEQNRTGASTSRRGQPNPPRPINLKSRNRGDRPRNANRESGEDRASPSPSIAAIRPLARSARPRTKRR